jgi:competence protein ComEC
VSARELPASVIRKERVGALLLVAACLSRCAGPPAATGGATEGPPPSAAQRPQTRPSAAAIAPSCGEGRLRVHFYDVGEGLAALVDLPDGQHLLVDAGDRPDRPGCPECARHHAHLLESLDEDLRGAPLALLWITHPHSDHVGGAPSVIDRFGPRAYVDNGLGADRPEVRRAREAARRRGAFLEVVDPGRRQVPITVAEGVTLRPVVPRAWPAACADDANECSIGLRIDWCGSSVLFMGDAEHEEERELELGGPVSVLQVAHHGSDTSSSPAFLARARPRYAVISAAAPAERLNITYCHPRTLVVRRLTRVLGGPGTKTLESFDGVRCDRATDSDWVAEPASDRLWATERNGDVVLSSPGGGVFVREGDR